MKCTAKAKSTGKRCRRDAMVGMTACYKHGGATPTGLASPQWKHGRYSKHLPARLAGRYAEALADPRWASLRDDAALLDARVNELLDQLDQGESGALWATVAKRWADVQAARNDPAKFADALNRLGAAIEAGAAESQRWAEVRDTLEQRRRVIESERRRALELGQMVTAEQAAGVFEALTEAIRRHVTDRDTLSALSRDLARLGNLVAGAPNG